MFIFDLRGVTGTRISLRFHLIFFFSGLSLYIFRNPVIEISICALTLFLFAVTILHMRRHRDELTFSTERSYIYTFPEEKGQKRVVFYFNLLVFIPMPLSLGSLMQGGEATGEKLVATVFFYYIGSIGLVGLLNLIPSKIGR